jgi:hypothetical protein
MHSAWTIESDILLMKYLSKCYPRVGHTRFFKSNRSDRYDIPKCTSYSRHPDRLSFGEGPEVVARQLDIVAIPPLRPSESIPVPVRLGIAPPRQKAYARDTAPAARVIVVPSGASWVR